MTSSISGKIATHEKTFYGSIVFDQNSGLIQEILPDKIIENSKKFSDSCVIFPGFGDIHVHAREDASGKHTYKEDYLSCGNAAINGGVVQICDMPNNPIPPIDDSSYNQKKILSQKSPIHVTLYAGVGPDTQPLSQNVPYKAFMGPSIGELYFKNNEDLEKTISRYTDQNVSFHCEDPIILEKSKSERLHEDRRPREAELLATDFALYLIEKYNLRGKLCHYSTGDGLKKIIQAKEKGIRVTCEVTPTHLFFDRSMLNEENYKWFQMNPPLRNAEDKEILLQALKDGHIDYLATDHAPHTREEKENHISGISQLDTFGLFATHLILEKNVSLQKIAEVCSKNPGSFVQEYLPTHFGKGFGVLEPGYSASFTILNLQKPTVFSKEKIKSKSGWSPFEGHTFPGSIESVFYHGKEINHT